MHHALVEQYGGAHGIRDEGLIESALTRPRNLLAYEPSTVAAALCFGLAKNHGYVDGNKRVAFTAAAVFLRLNGLRLVAEESEVVTTMVYVATGERTQAQLGDWIRACCTR